MAQARPSPLPCKLLHDFLPPPPPLVLVCGSQRELSILCLQALHGRHPLNASKIAVHEGAILWGKLRYNYCLTATHVPLIVL